jgi:hypothetical protein
MPAYPQAREAEHRFPFQSFMSLVQCKGLHCVCTAHTLLWAQTHRKCMFLRAKKKDGMAEHVFSMRVSDSRDVLCILEEWVQIDSPKQINYLENVAKFNKKNS